MSVIMLVIQPGGPSRDPRSKTEARRLIVAHYIGNETVEPYQRKLREAVQAYHRGDYRREQACYREVLSMLHDESIPEVTGLTGMRRDTKPPNDRHLEDLLAVLLGKG